MLAVVPLLVKRFILEAWMRLRRFVAEEGLRSGWVDWYIMWKRPTYAGTTVNPVQ